MDKATASRETEQLAADQELLGVFARLLRDRYGARLYLFGSRARGMGREYSDYDLVAVSPAFRDQSRFRRCLDREEMWVAAGGWRKALDLHCYTPEEFRRELRGLGYLGHARKRGELIPIRLAPKRRAGTAA